ncbi:CheR family methyltransferase [Paucidesulfovibrio longus]|uniref:CheR family methyltransferase n=1 Tax=Paucidesulfovibrio longus TaxID=889 RepID=UPI0003B4C039|nr:protein-glutamate O-methyltransferase CheR [Paucidesulfovibrio longus]
MSGGTPPSKNRGSSLSDKDFLLLSDFITAQLGIKMPPSKKPMLEARLHKRLRLLGIESYAGYRDYLFSEQGQKDELPHLYDAVTTNTTHFFRESNHFDALTRSILPGLHSRLRGGRALRVWSAGCSTGEEPYTLCMVLSEFAERCQGFRFEVLATDISQRVLDTARRAVYVMDKMDDIPAPLRKKYLLRSKDPKKRLMRIAPELRSLVRFERMNFMEPFHLEKPRDVVFCRNVVIYFDRPTQERLFRRIAAQIADGGYLFTGHSESLTGMDVPLVPVAPTIYRKV